MAELEDGAIAFGHRLKNDRLIKLYIGDEVEPYLMQQSTLERASDFFVNAIKHDTLGGNEPGAIRFPEDCPKAFEIFLFWIAHHRLPTEHTRDALLDVQQTQLLLVKAWALGHKYLSQAFQDIVILELIWIFEKEYLLKPIACEALVATPPNSQLRRLVAEEAILIVYGENIDKDYHMDVEELVAACEGAQGVTSALLEAAKGLKDRGNNYRVKDGAEAWKEYMNNAMAWT